MTANRHALDRTDADLEAALVEALAVEPNPSTASALYERVAKAMVVGPQQRGGLGRIQSVLGFRPRSLSGRQRAGLLLSAILILGGAGRGLLGMYESMVGPAGGWRTAWDRATVLGVSQTVDGYQVTIERAYADPSQLMLAISVRDTEDRGWSQVSALGADVVDEAGRTWEQFVGMSSPDGSSTAANLAWFSAPPGVSPGVQTLRVTMDSVSVRDMSSPPADSNDSSWYPWHEVAGPWTFSIALDLGAGTVGSPQGSDTVAGVTVRLAQVIVAETQVRATIAIDASDKGTQWWAPIGAFEHAGRSYTIVMSGSGEGGVDLRTMDGTADSSGNWVLRIDELVGDDANGQVRLQGPWVIEFTLP